jgi:trans-aconitate methyltransferase
MAKTRPKPGQWSTQYAQVFKDQSVVDSYRLRPAYVPETFQILAALMQDQTPKRILDAGCGTGFLARELINHADQIDAVDFSAAAIERGKDLPGGDSPKLRWIHSPLETAALQPPYALITAAASLHWMDWDIVLPVFNRYLLPGAFLALVENIILPPPWADDIRPLIAHYSMNKEFRPADNRTLRRELSDRHLFQTLGERRTATTDLHQSVADYVGSFHARNGLSRDRLGEELSQEFDDRLTALVMPFCPSGYMTLDYYSRVIWGAPLTTDD